MQTTLLGLAIALILALLTALLGPFFIDWNQYRPSFEAQASRLIGLPVRVHGQIDARLLPTPSLLLSGIEIGSGTSGQPLRAQALGIELALGDLMRGQIRATDLRLVGPDVAVSLDKGGRLNVPSLDVSSLAVGFNLNDVSIGKLSIEDARLSFADAASNTRFVFDKIWFNGEVRSLAGVFRGEGALVLDGALYGYRISSTRPDDGDARIKFSFEPSERPLLGEGEGTLSFAQGIPRFEGSLTLARPAGATLAGKAALNEPWRMTSRVTATPASALFEQIEFQYGPDERALKMTGTAETAFGAQPRTDGVFSARQVDLDRALASQDQTRRDPLTAIRELAAVLGPSRLGMPLRIGFGIEGQTLGGATVQSLRGDVAIEGDAWSFKGVELRAPGVTQMQLSGRMAIAGDRLSFAGPVDINSADPRAFMAWLEGKSDASAGGASPLRGNGEVIIDDTKLAVERLNIEIDRKPVTGRVVYTYPATGKKARLDAELKAADADIDAALALVNGITKDSRIERPGEISLALDLDRARFAGIDAQQSRVKASYDATGIKIERLSIGDFGGMKIDGEGAIDTTSATPQGSMTLRVAARDLSGLLGLSGKFAPQSADLLRGVPERTGAATLRATLDVGAAPDQRGRSLARVNVAGSLGSTRININGNASGTLSDWTKADIGLDGALEDDNAAALLRLTGLDRVFAAGKTPGTLTLSSKGTLSGEMRADARVAASDLDVRVSGVTKDLFGEKRSGTFEIAVAKADAAPLVQYPQALPGVLNAQAALSGTGVKFTKLNARVGNAGLNGQLGFTFGSVVGVEGEIETESANLPVLAAAVSGLRSADRLTSEEPFGTGLNLPLNGRVGFRAKTITLSDTASVADVKGALRFAPSSVAVEIQDGVFAKGRVQGEISLRRSPDGSTGKARIALKGADANAIMPGPAAIPGRVNLDFDVEGAGRSARALIGALSGSGTLTLADARVASLDPKAFAVAMRAVDQGLPLDGIRVRDIVAPALDGGVLSVRAAEVPFTVAAGQVRFGTLVAQADGAEVAMSGMFDLQDRTLDSRILMTDPSSATSAGKPEISIQLKGPVGAPARTIDVAALTGWLALRAVEQQSRRLEAIERGGSPAVTSPLVTSPSPTAPPVTSSVPSGSVPSAPPPAANLPERLPILPRTRPAETAAPIVAPLPPPVDIKPAPGIGDARTRPQSRPAPQGPQPQARESSF